VEPAECGLLHKRCINALQTEAPCDRAQDCVGAVVVHNANAPGTTSAVGSVGVRSHQGRYDSIMLDGLTGMPGVQRGNHG
jgi:hypothetical protein